MSPTCVNLVIIFGGGTLLSPFTLQALGTEASPPSIGFILAIFSFTLFGGLSIFLWDSYANGDAWVRPSLSASLLGEGKQAQSQFISGVFLCWLGSVCMLLGGRGARIEWVGTLPFLIGLGLLASVAVARKLFPTQFSQ